MKRETISILGKHAFLSSSFLYLAGGLCWYSDTLRLRSVSCPRVSDISFAGVQSIAAVSSLMSQGITHTERRTNMPLLRLHSKSLSLFLRLALWLYTHKRASTLAHKLPHKHTQSETFHIFRTPVFSSVTWRAESICAGQHQHDNIKRLYKTRWFYTGTLVEFV